MEDRRSWQDKMIRVTGFSLFTSMRRGDSSPFPIPNDGGH
jgi:hypothetical protein